MVASKREGSLQLQWRGDLSESLGGLLFPEDAEFHRKHSACPSFSLRVYFVIWGKTHLCAGFCLSVFISVGFPFDFYCRKTVIFLESGVSHTKSSIIFCGASAVLQFVEFKLKMMIRFCSAVFFPQSF